jgi:hypothetical protein
MKARSDAHPALHDLEPSVDAFLAELLRGLSRRPKSIAAKFFYDEMASRDLLNPLAPPGRRLEGIREILRFVDDLAVAELHNTHRV